MLQGLICFYAETMPKHNRRKCKSKGASNSKCGGGDPNPDFMNRLYGLQDRMIVSERSIDLLKLMPWVGIIM